MSFKKLLILLVVASGLFVSQGTSLAAMEASAGSKHEYSDDEDQDDRKVGVRVPLCSSFFDYVSSDVRGSLTDHRYQIKRQDGTSLDLDNYNLLQADREAVTMKAYFAKAYSSYLKENPEKFNKTPDFQRFFSRIPSNLIEFTMYCTGVRGLNDDRFNEGLENYLQTIESAFFYDCCDIESPILERESMKQLWFTDCSKLKSPRIKVGKLDWLGFARCSKLDENIVLDIEELGRLEINYCNHETIARVLQSKKLPREVLHLVIFLNRNVDKLATADLRKIFQKFQGLQKVTLINCRLNAMDLGFIDEQKEANPNLAFDIKENYA